MERLALCSKIFFDRDVIEKHKEILELKKQIPKPPPVLVFNSFREFEDAQDEIFQKICNVICDNIDFNDLEYAYMESFGLTPRQDMYINMCLRDELFSLTGDDDWSLKTADRITDSINDIFRALISSGVWKIVYENTPRVQLSDMIFKSVTNLLHLDEIVQYKCKKCGKNFEDDMCCD